MNPFTFLLSGPYRKRQTIFCPCRGKGADEAARQHKKLKTLPPPSLVRRKGKQIKSEADYQYRYYFLLKCYILPFFQVSVDGVPVRRGCCDACDGCTPKTRAEALIHR